MVANPARDQLNRDERYLLSLSTLFAPESLVSRDGFGPVPSRVSLLIIPAQAESGAYSRGEASSPSSCFPRRRPSIRSTTIESVPSSSRQAIAYRWRSPPRVRRRRTRSHQESFNDWGGGGLGCHKLVFVLGGDGTKIAQNTRWRRERACEPAK